MRNTLDTNRSRSSKILGMLSGELGLLIILGLLVVGFSLASEYFFTSRNLLNITRQVSINFIVAVGMTFLLLLGEIDLSVGSTAALVGIVTAWIMTATSSFTLAILGGLTAGAIAGLIISIGVVYGRVQSFIVTLAMMGIARGVGYVWTHGYPISGLPLRFGVLGAGYVGSIPVSSIIALAVFAVAYVILNKTKHGLYIRAIGANPEAARLSAIKIRRYRISGFVATGLLTGLGGLLITSRLLSAQPTAAMGMEIDVIAAAILGGATLTGGIGTIHGTALGALIIGVISNGLNLLGVSPFYQPIVKGLIILFAIVAKQRSK